MKGRKKPKKVKGLSFISCSAFLFFPFKISSFLVKEMKKCLFFIFQIILIFSLASSVSLSPMDFKKLLTVEKRARDHLVIRPIDAKNHKETVVFMHGLGDSPMGFLDLFFSPASPFPPSTKVLLLKAPDSPVSLNMGMVMPSWFDIKALGSNRSPSEEALAKELGMEEVEANAKWVTKEIDEEVKILGGNAKRVFVGGFSQGAVMSLKIGLEYPQQLGGIIGLSGFVVPNIKPTPGNFEGLETRILLHHGEEDGILPFDISKKQYTEFFGKTGKKYSFNSYKYLDHGLAKEELDQLAKDFKRLISEP